MLIITARIGESIRIGDVEIVLQQVRGAQVRIGINAPREIKVTTARLREAREEKAPEACASSAT